MSDVLAVARTTTGICQLARETAAELLLESPLQLIDLDPSDDTRIARILALGREEGDDGRRWDLRLAFVGVARLQHCLEKLRGAQATVTLGEVVDVLLLKIIPAATGGHQIGRGDRVCREAIALLVGDRDADAAFAQDVSCVLPHLRRLWREDLGGEPLTLFGQVVGSRYAYATTSREEGGALAFLRCVRAP